MPQTGARRDPYQSCNFFVEIEGIVTGGFTECGGLQVELETKELREGGVNDYVHTLRGRIKYPPLTFKRGITDIDGLWQWYQDVAKGVVKRKNGTIYLLNRAHEAVMRWDFKDAIPTKWTGPDFRSDANSVAFESIELVHRGLKWKKT
jgi:phage tail-like protein